MPSAFNHQYGRKCDDGNSAKTLQISTEAMSPRQLLHILKNHLEPGSFSVDMRRDAYIVHWNGGH
jgi:hypothetical protein